MRYVDPDGREVTSVVLWWIGADIGVPEPTDAIPLKWIGYGTAVLVAVGIDYVATKIVASVGEKTKNNDEVTMYHYSDIPPSEFKGALRVGSYVTPDIYDKGSEAAEKLAIPRSSETGEDKEIQYRYTIRLRTGEYIGAQNSLENNIVAPLDGKTGGGKEFIITVPKIPVMCEEISK